MCAFKSSVWDLSASLRRLGRALCLGMAPIMFVVASAKGEPPSANGAEKPSETKAEASPAVMVSGLDEHALIERIERLSARGKAEVPAGADLDARVTEAAEVVATVDALLKTYPETVFRDTALGAKLSALALLARTQSGSLDALLALTEEISSKQPSGELASENAFCAIQAFVLGARREQMPEQKRLEGAVERYRAFLADFPKSSRRDVIWASLIRNMIAMKQVDAARAEINDMEKEFPKSAAVKRSKGEINRARAPGQPFALSIKTASGEKIGTKGFFGDVVVIHFWASWNKASVEQLAKLAALMEKHKDKGLRVVGVSLDKSRERFDDVIRDKNVTWPQMYDAKGPESEIVMACGVVELPLVFTVDRTGRAYSVDRGDDLEQQVAKLLADPVPPLPPLELKP